MELRIKGILKISPHWKIVIYDFGSLLVANEDEKIVRNNLISKD